MPITEDTRTLAFRESWLRSLVKTVTYRILSIAGTIILSWLITKDIEETISITVAIQIYLTILYYSWERIWDKIGWGRKTEIN